MTMRDNYIIANGFNRKPFNELLTIAEAKGGIEQDYILSWVYDVE